MNNVLITALLIVVSWHTSAQTEKGVDFDCSDYYGLNICGDGFGAKDNQITNLEENQNALTTNMQKVGPVFSTSLTNEDTTQIKQVNTFKNSDSFRAYSKTLGNTDSTKTNSEFSVTKRIVDNKNFDLDCRLVTNTIYELSSSNYYDCALQSYF